MFATKLTLIFATVAVVAQAAPLTGVARDVKSDMLVLAANNGFGSGANEPVEPFRDNGRTTKIPTGEALDLFYRFGFFSLSVRVVPREDAGSWLIREPTAAVFEDNSVSERITQGSNKFDSQFQIFFADDVEELMEAYFRDFTAEGVEQPHKLFTGSWHKTTKSRYLGLSKATFESQDGVSFVLAKLPKTRAAVSMTGNPVLKGEAAEAAREVRNGDEQSVLAFTKNYGSHLIRDVVVGDVIYQVFALTPDQYASAKASVSDMINLPGANGNPVQFDDARFGAFYRQHLAPWQVKETGKIGVASGDIDVFRFVERELTEQSPVSGTSYPNVFRLKEEPALMQRLESLTAETSAVTGMHFQSLRMWIPDLSAREYYDGIMATQSALWEANL